MTDQERKAMEMALEWMNKEGERQFASGGWAKVNEMNGVMRELRQALNVDAIDTSSTYVDENEKRKHEPVLWKWSGDGWSYEKPIFPATPLYTAPPSKQWQSLTDEEIDAIESGMSRTTFVRNIEAALREKNT